MRSCLSEETRCAMIESLMLPGQWSYIIETENVCQGIFCFSVTAEGRLHV